jgi:hypothetical protein
MPSFRPSTRTARRPARGFRPALELLEDRWCPTAVTLTGNALQIEGDATDNMVHIEQNDATNTLRVTYDAYRFVYLGPPGPWSLNGGWRPGLTSPLLGSLGQPPFRPLLGLVKETFQQTFQSSAVQSITVSLHDGNDTFHYELESDTRWAKSMTVNLGDHGAKQADVDLDALSSHTLHANFAVTVNGGASTDVINFNQTNRQAARAVNIDAGVAVDVQLNGGSGVNSLNANYRGQLNGYLDMRVLGYAAGATGAVDAAFLAGSFGAVSGRIDYVNPNQFNPTFEAGSLIGYFDTPAPLPSAPTYSVTVNRRGLSHADLQNLEQELRQLDPHGVGIHWLPSAFWYDDVSGAVGLMGQGTSGFGPAGLNEAPLTRNLFAPLPADASTVNTPLSMRTGVYVNGREITQPERDFLLRLVNRAPAGAITLGLGNRYTIQSNGTAFNQADPAHSVNLIQLANQLGSQHHTGPLSTYDLTGISVLSDGDYLGVLYGN